VALRLSQRMESVEEDDTNNSLERGVYPR